MCHCKCILATSWMSDVLKINCASEKKKKTNSRAQIVSLTLLLVTTQLALNFFLLQRSFWLKRNVFLAHLTLRLNGKTPETLQ